MREDGIRQSEAPTVLEGTSTRDESMDAALARELWPLLSLRRADTYEAWRDVGFAMHNTSPELLDAWHAFSAQSAKYVPETCSQFWARLDPREGGLRLGSIVMWAQEDTRSPELVSAARARAAERLNRCVTRPVLEMEHDEGGEVEANHVIDYSGDSDVANGTATAAVRSPVAVPTTVSSYSTNSARTEHATIGAAFSDPHAVGEVLADPAHPCRLFFSFSWPDTQFPAATLATQGLEAVCAFLARECATSIQEFVPGENCQVAWSEEGAPASAGLSVQRSSHVRMVFDMLVRNRIIHGELVVNFAAYLLDNAERFDKLVYEKTRTFAAERQPTRRRSVRRKVPALDVSTYYRAQAIVPIVGRAANASATRSEAGEAGETGEATLRTEFPLRQASERSSRHAVDHAVGVYRGEAASGGRDTSAMPMVPYEKQRGRSVLTLPMCRRLPDQLAVDGNAHELAALIDRWPAARDAFPLGVYVASARVYADSCAHVHLRGDTPCPYGKCGRGGNSDPMLAPPQLRLLIASTHDEAMVMCRHPACEQVMDQFGAFVIDSGTSPSSGVADREDDATDGNSSEQTLHPQESVIDWAEKYNSPRVRTLPDKPIVAVRSAMSTGKSEAVLRAIRERSADAHARGDPPPSMLMLTYSRSLATKLATDFAEAGVQSYRQKTGALDGNRLVVCLNRVQRTDFDIVVVDEAISSFPLMNSPLMVQSGAVWAKCVEVVVRARRNVYFLDAAMDDTGAKLLVEDCARLKGIVPSWVWNEGQYPDPIPRTAYVWSAPLPGLVNCWQLQPHPARGWSRTMPLGSFRPRPLSGTGGGGARQDRRGAERGQTCRRVLEHAGIRREGRCVHTRQSPQHDTRRVHGGRRRR
jgi:Primase C terminal 2 (PriCT-2)/Origin of replication binding protein